MEAQVAPPVSHETVVRWGGRVLVLQRADNETGFLNVNKQKDRKRKKPYYAKYKPHGEAGQRTLPDSYSETAWEAAAKLAYHLEVQQQLPAKAVRAPRRSSEVSRPRRPIGAPAALPIVRRCPQEVQLEKEEKKAKKQATLAAKLAARNVENMPVQPVFTVPAGLSSAPVVVAVPFGSPVAMQPMPSPFQPVAVARRLEAFEGMLGLCVLHAFVMSWAGWDVLCSLITVYT